MEKESFEKWDESLMKNFKSLREKEIPPEILKGFSASVERRISGKQDQKGFRRGWLRSWIPAFVPALGVLVLVVSSVLLKEPSRSSLPLALSVVSDLAEEIRALEELGVWTEEDDAAVDVSLIEP